MHSKIQKCLSAILAALLLFAIPTISQAQGSPATTATAVQPAASEKPVEAKPDDAVLKNEFQSMLEKLTKLKPGKDYVQDEVLTEAASVAEAMAQAQKLNATVKSFSVHGYAVLKLKKGGTLTSVLKDSLKRSDAVPIYPNYICYAYEAEASASDPLLYLQYGHKDMNDTGAWKISKGSSSVTVAIIDSGIDIDHPEFSGRILSSSYNARDKKVGVKYVNDDQGHGTHVAGIIAAAQGNGKGGSGVAPNVKIMMIKANEPNARSFSSASIIEGIYYAADHGAKVLNMSLGRSYYAGGNSLEQKAIQYAVKKNVVVICAAGNDSLSHAGYPSAYPECLSVSALREGNVFDSSYSNYGPEVDVSAPGTQILSTYPDKGYAYLSGTSMACPQVAGVAALIRSYFPKLSVNDVKKKLCDTAVDEGATGLDNYYGYGAVNAYRALLTYTVKYNSKGGSTVASVKVGYNSLISAPKSPTRSKYHFVGWYKDSACKTAWNFASSRVKANLTLYAKWVSNNVSVTLNSQGGTAVSKVATTYGSKIKSPKDPTRNGYTFGGWYKDSACTAKWNFTKDTVKDNITLYAKWTMKTFTVTFNSQGGSAVAAMKVMQYAVFKAPAAPTRLDCTFLGWYRDSACTKAWNFATDKVNANMTLYAKWVKTTFTVTFNSQGGSVVAPVKVKLNNKLGPPPVPIRDGYAFVGWYRDSACTIAWNFAANTVTGDITLYAKWKDDLFVALNISGLSTPMDSPQGIAVDGAGNIYVADTDNYRVLIFRPSGALAAEFSLSGSSIAPYGIAVNKATGHIYITDGYSMVHELDTAGNIVRSWGGSGWGSGNGMFSGAKRIAVNSAGEVLVGDLWYVQKFSSTGDWIKQWYLGYYYCTGLAARGSDIYVADSHYDMIRVYHEADTSTYTTFAPSSSTTYDPSDPLGMTFDPNGNLYIADMGNYRIVKLKTDGTVLGTWGSYGSGNNQFNSAQDVGAAPDGTVYALDSGNNRIMVKRP